MLHQALKHIRRFNGVKQQALAANLQISNSYLSEIESGLKAHAITVDLLERYSEIFNVPVSTILLFSEQLESGRKSEKFRVATAKQVEQVMEWIDGGDE